MLKLWAYQWIHKYAIVLYLILCKKLIIKYILVQISLYFHEVKNSKKWNCYFYLSKITKCSSLLFTFVKVCGRFKWIEKDIDFHICISHHWKSMNVGVSRLNTYMFVDHVRAVKVDSPRQVSFAHQKERDTDTKSQGEVFTAIDSSKGNCLTFCASSHKPSVLGRKVLHDESSYKEKHWISLNSIKWCDIKETQERKLFQRFKKGNKDEHSSLY